MVRGAIGGQYQGGWIAQAGGLLEELWGAALSPDAAARLDLKSFLANPSVGGEAQMAAEMW